MAVPEERISRMQRRIARVWHRFAYTHGKSVRAMFLRELKGSAAAEGAWPLDVDAFGTIMQWLYSRIPHTRGSRQQPSKQ